MSRISRRPHKNIEKEKLLLWEYSQRYQNNLQQAFQLLHYPFPHEQKSAAKDRCTEYVIILKSRFFGGST